MDDHLDHHDHHHDHLDDHIDHSDHFARLLARAKSPPGTHRAHGHGARKAVQAALEAEGLTRGCGGRNRYIKPTST